MLVLVSFFLTDRAAFFIVWFDLPVEQASENNLKRPFNEIVNDDSFRRMAASFEPPLSGGSEISCFEESGCLRLTCPSIDWSFLFDAFKNIPAPIECEQYQDRSVCVDQNEIHQADILLRKCVSRLFNCPSIDKRSVAQRGNKLRLELLQLFRCKELALGDLETQFQTRFSDLTSIY